MFEADLRSFLLVVTLNPKNVMRNLGQLIPVLRQMFLEGANDPFSGVASMSMGRNKLILHVICGEEVFKSRGCLIVQGLKFGFETFCR
jgi:hypothetical protein